MHGAGEMPIRNESPAAATRDVSAKKRDVKNLFAGVEKERATDGKHRLSRLLPSEGEFVGAHPNIEVGEPLSSVEDPYKAAPKLLSLLILAETERRVLKLNDESAYAKDIGAVWAVSNLTPILGESGLPVLVPLALGFVPRVAVCALVVPVPNKHVAAVRA